MNTMYYGVPQSRERIIFIGVRKDIGLKPTFPIPSKKLITVRSLFPNVISQSRGQFDKKFVSSGRPAYTLTKTMTMMFKTNDGRTIRPNVNHLLKITSFPDDWKLHGSHSQKWARLGNAVMPKFMQVIAETIKKDILNG